MSIRNYTTILSDPTADTPEGMYWQDRFTTQRHVRREEIKEIERAAFGLNGGEFDQDIPEVCDGCQQRLYELDDEGKCPECGERIEP